MPRLRPALLLCTALAAPLVGAASASAQTTPLTGFGDFGSDRVQMVLDDLGLANGDPIPSQGGATLTVTTGDPARYYEDFFSRESGLDAPGSVGNFVSAARPYPDVNVSFASPIHRVGFEARVNDEDELAISLLLAGVLVDRVVVPSRGSDMLYFYGVQNPAGFDQVVVDAVEHASGAFTLDNLTFESLVTTPPPDPDPEPDPDPTPDPDPDPDPNPDPGPDPGALTLSCEGFDSFPRVDRSYHVLPVRALLAELHDASGAPVTDEDLASSPSLRVMFSPEGGGPALDVTQRVVWRSPEFSFLGRRAQRWFVWVLPWHMRGYGTYVATLESGDPAEYKVDPTCADWTLNKRPTPPQTPHRERDCKDPRNHRNHQQLPEPRRGGRH